MSITLTTSIPCNFCRFCSTLPMYKLIFLHFTLSGRRSMTDHFATVFFLATDRRAEFHSLLMGLIRSCSCQRLSCTVSYVESSGFMDRCFMLTGVSSPEYVLFGQTFWVINTGQLKNLLSNRFYYWMLVH